MKHSCYYVICFGCLIGNYMLFYIIFGTNLLTEGPVPVFVFLPILEFCRKGIPNGMKPSRWSFLDRKQTRRLGDEVRHVTRRPRGRRARPGGRCAPHPHGPLVAPPTYFFHLYILLYPRNNSESYETTFPPPQPSVPVRSHLGAFSNVLPEGDSIMEGFYINTITSPMKRE